MSNSHTTTTQRPLFFQRVSQFSSAVSAVNATSRTGNHGSIVGATLLSVIQSKAERRAARYGPHDTYSPVDNLKLEAGKEGDVCVKKSLRSGNLFVVKHSVYRRATAVTRAAHDGQRKSKLPTEAVILKNFVKPHPNIVVLHAYVEDRVERGRFYIYMDACTGGDLFDQMSHWDKRKQSTPKLFLYHAIVQISDAFAFLHHGLRHTTGGCFTQDEAHHAIVHGDVKYENILLDWSRTSVNGLPELVIGDFGHAKLLSDPEPRVDSGTEAWFDPETKALWEAYGPVGQDHRLTTDEKLKVYYEIGKKRSLAGDVYSLGLVFKTMATESPIDSFPAWSVGQDEELLALSREDGLRDLVYGCLRVDPDKRVTMGFDDGAKKGIMGAVNRLRALRDRMVVEEVTLDPTEWFRRPAPVPAQDTRPEID
ncbi:hypothetical protein CERZMDRAFT_101254 [Cercospora zeae-maydis SCOH1-5]|uniref:non-specific serine/threonine protein kinase n=1 Tax=Cercospora zeae-maydis SCOH1-5 TaxID=717836 RepID=A0A6A6F3K5_9PEZI|nr:hypothetical protein CERZMDRAFT_101254 [Cercospora zeae-maydis SCOH1-5]